jgi:hypothetical protein
MKNFQNARFIIIALIISLFLVYKNSRLVHLYDKTYLTDHPEENYSRTIIKEVKNEYSEITGYIPENAYIGFISDENISTAAEMSKQIVRHYHMQFVMIPRIITFAAKADYVIADIKNTVTINDFCRKNSFKKFKTFKDGKILLEKSYGDV